MLKLLYQRRSVREFTSREIDPVTVDKIIEGLLLSPSGRGLRPWEFIVVDDRKTIMDLSKSKEHGSSFLKDAPLAVVVLGSPEISDTWIEDTSIASFNALLMAESLGLGACWIQIRGRYHSFGKLSESYVKELLHIPENLAVESIIAFGFPDKKPKGYTRQSLPFERVHTNTYKNSCGV